jgi:hypothetical protein
MLHKIIENRIHKFLSIEKILIMQIKLNLEVYPLKNRKILFKIKVIHLTKKSIY